MKKVMEKLKKAMGNKGFSLVELVIVIAIMAALIGILAPQYTKYVEKSRITADEAVADTLQRTTESIVSDTEISASLAGTVVVDDTGTTITGDALKGEFAKLIPGYADMAFKSKKYTKADTTKYTVTVDADNVVTGAWTD